MRRIHIFGANWQNFVGHWYIDIGCFSDDTIKRVLFIKNNNINIVLRTIYAYHDVTIGLPLTENATSPDRGWRKIETGVIGLIFGTMVSTRSALAALRWGLWAWGRNFDRDGWETGFNGVFDFIWTMIERGPGVELTILPADWLRRRDFNDFRGAIVEIFVLFLDSLSISDSEVL